MPKRTNLARVCLLLLFIVAMALFFASGSQRYLTLDALQAHRAALADIYAAHPLALLGGFFALYVAVTCLSLPGAGLLTLAAGCLWFLLKRQWVLAGILAAIGTATRPNGVALIAACALASFIAIRDRREWRSLIAPLLSPLGFIGFMLWLDSHTGERGVWFRVQTEAWGEGTSFGLTAIRRTIKAFTNPLTSPTNIVTAASVLTLCLLLWFLRKHRLPPAFNAYVAVVVLLMLMPSTVTARPRFLFTAFPLLIAAAVWFERDKRDWWPYVIGACSAGLVGLTALYGVLGAIP